MINEFTQEEKDSIYSLSPYEENHISLDQSRSLGIIRTSGELRLSNFWTWESAYSEFYFTDIHWPDFNENELKKALDDYAGRDRRYGGLKTR